MPWNAKAQGLLREQYAPVAAAGRVALEAEIAAARAAGARGIDGASEMAQRLERRRADVEAYAQAYARYCWDVSGISGLKLAPFHLLAVEGRTLVDADHGWHLRTLAQMAGVSPLFTVTD